MSSSKRGGQRSYCSAGGPACDQLCAQARRRSIRGRWPVNKAEPKRKPGR